MSCARYIMSKVRENMSGTQDIACVIVKYSNVFIRFFPNIIFRFVKLNSKYRFTESSTAHMD